MNPYQSLTTYYRSLDFIKQFRGKKWRIKRLLIIGNKNYEAYQNKWQYKLSGDPTTLNIHQYIPNIFNYFEQIPISKHFPKNLLKLRILQFLKKQGGCTIVTIIDFLRSVYIDLAEVNLEDADKLIRKETREMIFSGILNTPIHDYEYATLFNSGDYAIETLNLANTFSISLKI